MALAWGEPQKHRFYRSLYSLSYLFNWSLQMFILSFSWSETVIPGGECRVYGYMKLKLILFNKESGTRARFRIAVSIILHLRFSTCIHDYNHLIIINDHRNLCPGISNTNLRTSPPSLRLPVSLIKPGVYRSICCGNWSTPFLPNAMYVGLCLILDWKWLCCFYNTWLAILYIVEKLLPL
jgi:hypothetical protein